MNKEDLYFKSLDKIDNGTEYDKIIYYQGADGRSYRTMDEVKVADNNYWDTPKKDKEKKEITDKGEVFYYTCDGKKCSSLRQVMEYNNVYYSRIMNKAYEDYIDNKGMHR